MPKTLLPPLDDNRRTEVIGTLTSHRLGKYLQATRGDQQQALRLYVLNTKVSAAFLADLHYVEIALRNKFDAELTRGYGAQWFATPAFVALMDVRCRGILVKAQKDAAKHFPAEHAVPPGKVIAELTFGFWLNLTDPKLEHSLWVPLLHKAFHPRKPPKRATFNQSLEKLRQLRNRVAHHEPIFHLKLRDYHRLLQQVAEALCPATARIMTATSSVQRVTMKMSSYYARRSL